MADVLRAKPGAVGHLKWHYYGAALLEGYTVARTEGAWTLTAHVVYQDAFKLTQRPLVFVAPVKLKDHTGTMQPTDWRWPVETFTITPAGELRARLGPPLP